MPRPAGRCRGCGISIGRSTLPAVPTRRPTGTAMRGRGYVPDITLCSNAKRARETLEGIAGQTDTGRVLFLDRLYSEDAAGYLSLIHENGAADPFSSSGTIR